jgi:NAD-dependent deacetylase
VDPSDQAVDAAARLIVDADHLVALVGAGLSVESGIPPFRGPGGLWTRLGEPSMDGYREFLDDPAEWWRQQQDLQADPDRTEFREAIERAEPNSGHLALAELERLGVLKMTITQNVDDLHRQAGQRRLAEIHGNRTRLRCIACESRWHRDRFEGYEYPLDCPECGGLVKSDTVMFGEPIPPGVLATCFNETEMCDCMIVCGTSATVFPAAGFPALVKERGGAVIEANSNPTPLSAAADVVLRGPTGVSLPDLTARIKALRVSDAPRNADSAGA